MIPHLSYAAVLSQYQSLDREIERSDIQAEFFQKKIRLIALDDDPTGIQTVHSCLLLTAWTQEVLHQAFQHPQPFFYVLTNTRALTREEATERTRSAMEAILKANQSYGYRLIFVSRSDSTLRGHFPLETDVMRQVLIENGIKVWPVTFFIPAFIEAGRFTLNGVHYLKDKDELIPVSETEFAKDNVFAYHHAQLENYLREKMPHRDLVYRSLSLDNFQQLPSQERDETTFTNENFVAVDALRYGDLQRFSHSFLKWISDFDGAVVLRTSSSLPKALSGIPDKALLEKDDLVSQQKDDLVSQQKELSDHCLFIVGSHVKKSSLQLQQLLQCPQVKGIELNINDILTRSESLQQEVYRQLNDIIAHHQTPVVYTARQEVRLDDADKRQHLGQEISDFLVDIVRDLPYQPRCLIAKGGITSHDILTKGLNVQSAEVMGQILSGVPCIKTSKESSFPNMPYVIFPGNVGDENSLVEVYRKLQ